MLQQQQQQAAEGATAKQTQRQNGTAKNAIFERVRSAACERDGTSEWKKLFPVTRRPRKKKKC